MSATEPASHGRVGEIAVSVQRHLESLYALEPEAPVTDYLVAADAVRHLPGGGSRTLVAQAGDEVSVGVVLDASVGAGLEQADPRERLDTSNLGPFSTLTEEVSHFLYVLFRARSDRPVTQLELELQGEVDKYLVVLFFRGLHEEGALSERLRQLLFARYELVAGLSAESSERYHEASRLANRYCGWLESRYLELRRRDALARETRRFWRLGQREKLETIASAVVPRLGGPGGDAPPRGARGARRKSAPGKPPRPSVRSVPSVHPRRVRHRSPPHRSPRA